MNLTTITIEFWFIPIDILVIIFITLAILLALVFLTIASFERRCRTVPMMLVCNSCLAELLFGCSMLSMAIFTLQNDMKQRRFEDSFCPFRGYLGFVTSALQNYSYTLQAFYRYITVVYPARIAWQSVHFQARLIGLKWLFSIVYTLPFLFTGQITYNPDNQICQLPLKLSVPIVYNALFLYSIPISTTIFVYFKLVRYVHRMSIHLTATNTLFRARRELRMVRRIVILVAILVTLGLPYLLFDLISFVTNPPKYHFCIAYIFANSSLALVMLALFKFTQPIQATLLKMRCLITNVVVPTNT